MTVQSADLQPHRPDYNVGGNLSGVTAEADGRSSSRPLGGRIKRCMDIAIALTALFVISPIMLLVAVLLFATGGRPIIYSHSRIGFRGTAFRCYKFRTMAANADDILREYLENNPDAAEEWKATRKLKFDPRVTKLGAILRKSSIDELPQLINILRGEMSCVGPRPVVADELSLYGVWVADYLQARPGLTGYWQVNGRNAIGYGRRVTMDGYYVQNWSVLLDMTILLWTLFAVIRFDDTS